MGNMGAKGGSGGVGPPEPAAADGGGGREPPELATVVDALRRSALAQDRRYRLKMYRRVMVGHDIVEWLSGHTWCASRSMAVELGRAMVAGGHLRHVTYDHGFEDDYLFYRFASDVEGGDVPLNKKEKAAREFDLVIVGAGSGGISAALFAADLGAKVALVERHHIGGDCTWTGCVPSKALLHAAKMAHHARTGAGVGVITGEVEVNMTKVRDYVYSTINKVYQYESPEVLETKGIRVFVAEGSFVDAHTMRLQFTDLRSTEPGTPPGAGFEEAKGDDHGEVGAAAKGERDITAHNFLLCTGARPMTYEQIFDNTTVPPRLAVMGAGPIGAELGQAYSRLGSKVTMIASKLLGKEEEAVREVLAKVFAREGIEVVSGRPSRVVRNEAGEIEISVGTHTVVADQLLVATGRIPNIESLNLEAAGIDFSPQGITVDDKLRTNVQHVYAAGDVTATRNALAPGTTTGHSDLVPRTTYTDPEVAKVGMDIQEARETYGDNVAQLRMENSHNDRSVCDDDLDGFVSIIVHKDGTIKGATIVAGRAGEMIAEICVAMKNGIKLKDLAGTIHPYPTYTFGTMVLAANHATQTFLGSASGKFVKSMYT